MLPSSPPPSSSTPAPTCDFISTSDFRRYLLPFLHTSTLLSIKSTCKAYSTVIDDFISPKILNGSMIVHSGKDISFFNHVVEDRRGGRFGVNLDRVVFLLNVTKVGDHACAFARNLVVVDIPEGVKSIGELAFGHCTNLTTVSFPRTLTTIGKHAFNSCGSLEIVDLLHTNLQEIGPAAFIYCKELKTMTIPTSLKTPTVKSDKVFLYCTKLVPSSIRVDVELNAYTNSKTTTSKIIDYLRSKTSSSSYEFRKSDYFRKHLLVDYLTGFDFMSLLVVNKSWSHTLNSSISDSITAKNLMIHSGHDFPSSFRDDYKPLLATKIIFILNTTQIGKYSCSHTSNLVRIDIPEGIEIIRPWAFYKSYKLTTINFPQTLKHIGERAFQRSLNLHQVDLSNTQVQEIGKNAFSDSPNLKVVNLPDTVKRIGESCFGKLVPNGVNDVKDIISYLNKL
ncbi:hypothetical protein TL16_g01181 [Triparma laevis f. inornata]|uniref:Uncharacterized protein n=1 Tax=Triparma laevis f. inornata TaxID=1714386 RepID=A0A9W7DS24_9STRA|nr:hypothetical protein TL16_g01181 [Triparma laevis f. inornata]